MISPEVPKGSGSQTEISEISEEELEGVAGGEIWTAGGGCTVC